MANPSIMVQKAILRQAQSFPILCHAIPAAAAISTAKRLMGGFK
jgi:hypothetical protein